MPTCLADMSNFTMNNRDRSRCYWSESSNGASNRTNAVIRIFDMPTENAPSAVDLSLGVAFTKTEYLAISTKELTA